MIVNKLCEKLNCRRTDDRIAAVITLEVNTFPVRMTAEGLFALADFYNKFPEACVAFNVVKGTGHYMAKNRRKLARLTRVGQRRINDYLDGQQSHSKYVFITLKELSPVLEELLHSKKLESVYNEACAQETVATAGDTAYKMAWFNLFNGRTYSYYSDPNIQRSRVSSAYTRMTNRTFSRPKQKVLH